MQDEYDPTFGKNVPEDFLSIAEWLRKIQDTDPGSLAGAAGLERIGRRTAYALARIDRAFGHLPVPREQLLKLGWTKLHILAPFVDDESYQELLELAETATTYELETILRGGQVVAGTRCLILRLNPDQYQIVEEVLLKHGAIKSGRGLVGKEPALTTAMSKLTE